MPTKYSRIPVTKDPALASALEEVTPLVKPGTRAATLVHDLAIRGAGQLVEEHRRQAGALEDLARRSTSDEGLDWGALEQVKSAAWSTGTA